MDNETSAQQWRPVAAMDVLRVRADVYEHIREFFKSRDVLEVDTPVVSSSTTPDPHIDSFITDYFPSASQTPGESRYLSTSPEFPMKRLLAAGSGSIYQLCHVFRQAEQGSRHNPEFTMLEWYRVEMSYLELMREVAALVGRLLKQNLPIEVLTYQAAFMRYLEIDPLTVTTGELQRLAEKSGLVCGEQDADDKDFYLDFFMSHQVQPQLGKGQLTFVHEYPASQCAYSKISSSDPRVAQRFELFFQGVELANGYQELTDAQEQKYRFEQQNKKRLLSGKSTVQWDENLVDALFVGMPDCSGVALGVDRLIQLILNLKNIEDVLAFPFNRA